MWRLVFSKYKLNAQKRKRLQTILEDYTYTYGSTLPELELGEVYQNVEIRDHACGDIIEKLYYSAELEPICVYCGGSQPFMLVDYYPQCETCSTLKPVSKK